MMTSAEEKVVATIEEIAEVFEELDMSSYKDDLAIDKDDLDAEWERQATLFANWSEISAYAVCLTGHAKEQVDIQRAELDEDIRNNPEDHFDEVPDKITEASVKAINLLLLHDLRYNS